MAAAARSKSAPSPAPARSVGGWRWLFLPLGMVALVAVGAHAAADVLGERILAAVDQVEAWLDALFGAWSFTAPLVNLVSVETRTFLARGAALVWELWADVLLAAPMMGWQERPHGSGDEFKQAQALVRRTAKRPTPLKLARPLYVAALSVAGACSVARLVRGTLLSLGALSRVLGALALATVLLVLASRAIVRSLEHADALTERKSHTTARALSLGAVGTLVLLPLALAALLGASPVWSFFR